jgi:hypothetical protein
MSLSDDLREFTEEIRSASDMDIITGFWARTDMLIENIEEHLGQFNEFDVNIAHLKLLSTAMITVVRRLRTT